MRRGRRFRRGSSAKRRSLNWLSSFLAVKQVELTSAGVAGFNDGDVICAWAKWPSRTVVPSTDPGNVPAVITSSDETLVRTIVGAQVTLNLDGITQSPKAVQGYFGIIPWDAEFPADLAGVIAPWPAVPHPADGSRDWLIRIPFCFTRDNFALSNQASEFITSRAMRKLPASTGLLLCFGAFDATEDGAHHTWDVAIDMRMLYKSGTFAGPT